MSEEHMHYGEDFEPPDQVAKVTGQAKYTDDIIMDGMLHGKTVKSPYAHAIVESIDTSEAEAMPGVHTVITYEDVPNGPQEDGNISWPALDQEPKTYGYPVAAVAADDEFTAAAAVEAVDVEYRVLEHVIDPIETLKPGSPNPRIDGNAHGDEGVQTIKWEDADFSGDFPEDPDDPTAFPGESNFGWEYGDLDAAFDEADVIVEDVQSTQPLPQNPMEPRSNIADWDNGHLILWTSNQSGTLTTGALLGYFGLDPDELTYIANYTGGGFGSKAATYPQQYLAAHLAQEAGQPVKLRGTRKEEFFWGNGRTEIHCRVRMGLTNEGELTACDLQIIGNGGGWATGAMSAIGSVADTVTGAFAPDAMRAEGVGVFTNIPKTWPMRGPGEMQFWTAIAPTLDKAAEELGMDGLELRKRMSADHGDGVGPEQVPNTSCYLEESLDMVAELTDYEDLVARNGEVEDGKVRGVGVGLSDHGAGSVGFDGMIVINEEGRVEVRTGIGNLGTYSYAAASRAAAETLKVPWEQVDIKWGGNEDQPWSVVQAGSNTTYTEGLTQLRAAERAITYLQEIAADELGGEPDDYVVEGGEVYHEDDSGQSLNFAEAVQYAIQRGGKYTGEEIPEDLEGELHPITLNALQNSLGDGLIALSTTGVDVYDDPLEKAEGPLQGGEEHAVRSYNVVVAEVGIDVETGQIDVENMVGVSDCGTVIHPISVKGQVEGGNIQGLGFALTESYEFDDGTGIPYNTDWYTNKTPTILDYDEAHGDAVDEPDFFGPHGAKGIGEPPYGGGGSAIRSAVYNALGTDLDSPMFSDKVLDALENGQTEV